MLNSVEPVAVLNLSTCPLPALASAVHLTVSKLGDGDRIRFGTRKVFVSAVFEALSRAGHAVDVEVVKPRLVDANRRGLLSLARADLVAAMPFDLVKASEIEDRWSTFHFVVDVGARDPWEVQDQAVTASYEVA